MSACTGVVNSHYITLFGTDEYYNKRKSSWGLSKFLIGREDNWKFFKISEITTKESNPYTDDDVKKFLEDHMTKPISHEEIPILVEMCDIRDNFGRQQKAISKIDEYVNQFGYTVLSNVKREHKDENGVRRTKRLWSVQKCV